jgi:hypothetical protein
LGLISTRDRKRSQRTHKESAFGGRFITVTPKIGGICYSALVAEERDNRRDDLIAMIKEQGSMPNSEIKRNVSIEANRPYDFCNNPAFESARTSVGGTTRDCCRRRRCHSGL